MSAAATKSGRSAAPLSPPLRSRAVVILTGLSYLCVGLGFSYLDRQYRAFGVESLLWLVWMALGFGAGARNVLRTDGAGSNWWPIMGSLGAVLSLFPGFALYALPRWVCFMLLLIMGARASVMHTRRDFYFSLIVVFTVSFMVATHARADWSLWFYLGPAWLAGGLALAWQHATGSGVSSRIRLGMTAGFMAFAFLLTAVLFLFAPRPPNLGFGFLPPATDNPGHFSNPGSDGGDASARASGGGSGQRPGDGSGGGQGGGASAGSAGLQQWNAMLGGMRAVLADPHLPGWQRAAIKGLLDAAQWVLDQFSGDAAEGSAAPTDGSEEEIESPQLQLFQITIPWFWMLLCLLAAYLLWRRRLRIGLWLALGAARLLATPYPLQSMRLSARAMDWCLQMHGYRKRPGQSVRERWLAAVNVAPLARRWLEQALALYGAARFSGQPVTAPLALEMRQVTRGACDVMLGVLPELKK